MPCGASLEVVGAQCACVGVAPRLSLSLLCLHLHAICNFNPNWLLKQLTVLGCGLWRPPCFIVACRKSRWCSPWPTALDHPFAFASTSCPSACQPLLLHISPTLPPLLLKTSPLFPFSAPLPFPPLLLNVRHCPRHHFFPSPLCSFTPDAPPSLLVTKAFPPLQLVPLLSP